MKDGFYWAWFVGSVEGDEPLIVEVQSGDVCLTGTDSIYAVNDFDFISKEPLPRPDRSA